MNISAAADTALVDAVEAGALGVKDNLIAIGTAVLPFAAIIVALGAGWRFARSFVRG